MKLLPKHAQALSKLITAFEQELLTQVEIEAVGAIAANSTASHSCRYRYGSVLTQLFAAASIAPSAGSALRTLRGWHGSMQSTRGTSSSTNSSSVHPTSALYQHAMR